MKKKTLFRNLIYFLITGLAVAAFLGIFSRLFEPDVSGQNVKKYSLKEIQDVEKARDVSFDPDNLPYNLYPKIDYSQGKEAKWYPKGQSPILAELVEKGKLPPVAERVGPEPVVMEGVESIGKYGGTWMRIATNPGDIGVISWRMSYVSLFRWGPFAYPIAPFVAKGMKASKDKREFVVTLRKGIKWSDGHPLTADDIMYWWKHEVHDDAVSGGGIVPLWMQVAGKPGNIEKIDDLRVKFSFPAPCPRFPELIARFGGEPISRPAHYLRQFHPTIGDKDLIERMIKSYKLTDARALYGYQKSSLNPEHPRLWPWIYRTYKSNPPQVFVRNPYYFVVDPDGNQLPYVDRVQFDVMDRKLLSLSAANGKVTMQTRHLRFENYTELMSRRKESGTRILYWYPATRSLYAINPNLNRRVEKDKPETKWKAKLLADKRFRQALSLAIDRKTIIKAEYNNQVEPAQIDPGKESPFHHEGLSKAFIDYDPDRANKMLDDLGLQKRDSDGYRTFPDGSEMVFYLDFCAFTGIGPSQFVVDDWEKVGVRTIPRERTRSLFSTEKAAMDFDFNVWFSASDYLPLDCPRYFVSHHTESFYAVGWGRWFMKGGFYGNKKADRGDAFPPPKDHPMYRSMEVYEEAIQAKTRDEQVRIFKEALDIAAENLWTINLTSPLPQLVVVKKGFRNVPTNALYGHIYNTPANAGIETYYFENPHDSPGAIANTKEAIVQITPRPGSDAERKQTAGQIVGKIIRWMFLGVAAILIVLVALRHPYIARRLLIMIPTLLIISLVVFFIIQLPPGDFLTARIMQLQESGDEADMKSIDNLKSLFHFDEPVWKRYCRWMGVYWFTNDNDHGKNKEGIFFSDRDEGLLQGNMGRSMATTGEVNKIVGDRVLLTFLISLGTVIFTWVVAIPIGIYSAVRQYSVFDYILTFVGFIGMCIPAFLLALILMALSGVSGLFSAEFAAQPEWDWPKVVDLLKHIWIPVIVLGVGGTAGMIRVMRANLLDELKKPYVTTARAKGVRPIKLLFKYPVRLALNPFISGIGGLFPQLVSGGAIVAMVLSLPTVGPLMLEALFSEDMYMAGSMLMVLSLLGVFGTLVSDLLLLWLDPRIRFKGGSR
ncbi:MAG: ABC transporter permease subunit [Phycisphaerae bacterium]|nr:ABC transporter permease subunit [Phycisphaerae bacterium]